MLSNIIREIALERMHSDWGERYPTWEEFNEALSDKRVYVNDIVVTATKAIFLEGMPLWMAILFGSITLGIGFFTVPILVGLYFFGYVNGWFVIASPFVSYIIIRIARTGMSKCVTIGASKHKHLYDILLMEGCFYIHPVK